MRLSSFWAIIFIGELKFFVSEASYNFSEGKCCFQCFLLLKYSLKRHQCHQFQFSMFVYTILILTQKKVYPYIYNYFIYIRVKSFLQLV